MLERTGRNRKEDAKGLDKNMNLVPYVFLNDTVNSVEAMENTGDRKNIYLQ